MTWFGANKNNVERSPHRSGDEQKYLVATGALVFTQHASSARAALMQVKALLKSASEDEGNRQRPGRMSQALLDSFTAGELDFIVMDGERTRLICGEYAGVFQQPVSRSLSEGLKHLIPPVAELNRRAEAAALDERATDLCA
ncbi:MAG: hypothetical protein U0105_02885 [Candidatus Obscuribacterales bacterium]